MKIFENILVGANGLLKEKQEEALEKQNLWWDFDIDRAKKDDDDDDDEYTVEVNWEYIYTLSSLQFVWSRWFVLPYSLLLVIYLVYVIDIWLIDIKKRLIIIQCFVLKLVFDLNEKKNNKKHWYSVLFRRTLVNDRSLKNYWSFNPLFPLLPV